MSSHQARLTQRGRSGHRDWGKIGAGLTVLGSGLTIAGVKVPIVGVIIALALGLIIVGRGMGIWGLLKPYLPVLIVLNGSQSPTDYKRNELHRLGRRCDDFADGLTDLLMSSGEWRTNPNARSKRVEARRLIGIYKEEHQQPAVRLLDEVALNGLRVPGAMKVARQPTDLGDLYELRDRFWGLSDRLEST